MALAAPVAKSARIVSSTNTIPVAFSTAAGSRVFTGLNDFQHSPYQNLMVLNETAVVISLAFADDDVAVPLASTTQRIYIPANTSVTIERVSLLDTIYIQSEGSAITSGAVSINIW